MYLQTSGAGNDSLYWEADGLNGSAGFTFNSGPMNEGVEIYYFDFGGSNQRKHHHTGGTQRNIAEHPDSGAGIHHSSSRGCWNDCVATKAQRLIRRLAG